VRGEERKKMFEQSVGEKTGASSSGHKTSFLCHPRPEGAIWVTLIEMIFEKKLLGKTSVSI
jgi:hypothetical protein